MVTKHITAKPSHYDSEAENYDVFNDEKSCHINALIENIFKQYKVNTILDLTCGTGSQVFWLHNKGFHVVGVDINKKMLEVAKKKAIERDAKIDFREGDMRTSQLGKFQAVITIFNAIGHLTQEDFEMALDNIHQNLDPKGIYIFDIFNLDYLLYKDNITTLTIDWLKENNHKRVREIQYSTINNAGILISYSTLLEESSDSHTVVSNTQQTLQVYSAKQLKHLLEKHGFSVMEQSDIQGKKIKTYETERIVTVAQRV